MTPSASTADEWISVSEAAKLLGVTPQGFDKIHQRRPRAFRIKWTKGTRAVTRESVENEVRVRQRIADLKSGKVKP